VRQSVPREHIPGRKDLYLDWADHVYMTDQGKSVSEEVEELIEVLRREGKLPGAHAAH
jgi:hypothetical protein